MRGAGRLSRFHRRALCRAHVLVVSAASHIDPGGVAVQPMRCVDPFREGAEPIHATFIIFPSASARLGDDRT
ncbi:hypothetical protein WS70_20440 [Burkholderia mayonis]|uniref:Uncharacterized protein n=1 Tax=Burkholderia mayonis TaxID=1385591 RepID=A0A1B4FKN1_9BURK|nr:hypothetical protein WS70_20440 [Burkholderia mayonis]KVE38556.1 hypothetical protein WS69_08620 [Burkholderia sp. BDU5]KVE43719.1 hypothetical protein WS70_08705 [Burkholderia mayonis]